MIINSHPATGLILAQLFFTLVAWARAQDAKNLPPLRQPRPRSVDVKRVALDLRFDGPKKQAFGVAGVTFSPLAPTNRLALDAAFFTVNSVTLANGAALKFDYEGGDKDDNLKITLDRVYQEGEEVTVKIDYRANWVNEIDPNSLAGSNGKGLRFSAPTSDDPLKMREIWSMGDPDANRYWFPAYDAPDDFRATELTATVDKKLAVISNGRLVAVKDNADGTRSFHWKADTPYANHLTSLVVGEFVNVRKNYQDIALNNFGYARERAWVDASTERLPDMARFFSVETGVKYPYPAYSQVFVQDIGSFTGNMNVATITENMVDDFPTHADFFYLWDLTEAEALAGQWFGSYLTARDWSEVWLNKGFARYFNCLYTEHRNGRAEWLIWVHAFDQSLYFGDWNAGLRRPIVTRHYENAANLANDNYSTARGALVLNMLRRHLGEEKWRQAIRLYVAANGHKAVTTEDFRRAVEKAAGETMGWFFDQWLYKMGHPVFAVTKSYDAAQKQLTLNVRQTQKIDPQNGYPQVEFFQGWLEIEIDGRVGRVWLKPQAENIFTFAAPNAPGFVNLDYENTWIRELNFEQTTGELLSQLQNSRDALARNAAARQLGAIAKDEKTPAEDKAKIRRALRNAVLGRDYWRLRNTALFQLAGLSNPLEEETIATLLAVIKNEKSWLRANAVGLLGATRNPKFAALYRQALNDESFRVINAAAIALGRTKDATAFDALARLKDRPSMKSQTLISALAGLKELGDPRGFDIAFEALSDRSLPRWRLPNPPVWDYRVFAADTIASLGKSDKAYPLIFERLKKSLAENDLNGVFYNLVLITTLADPRGREVFELLKTRFADDANALNAVKQYEAAFNANSN
jgi:aminopeptidase N